MRLRARHALVLTMLLVPAALLGQGTPVQTPQLDFSGVLFLNYQMRTDSASKLTTGGKAPNKFDIERVYLIFRMPAGDRAAIRVTTDIFQNTAGGYYNGWTARLKHAYLQYEFSKNFAGVQGLTALGRFGMLHTVVVDHIETFWPRYLGNTDVERNGFFASADVGASTLLTLPKRRGEIYATITNGSNYTSAETDRFKDFAARFSWTPFGSDSGLLRTFTVTPWYYKGSAGSAFAAPPNSISQGLQKDRRGIFVGVKDRRLIAGANFAQRVEETETAPPARTVTGRTSQLVSGFALVRPAEWMDAKKKSSFGLLARMDQFKLNKDLDPSTRLTVFGAFYDVNQRVTATLDYQDLAPKGTPSPAVASKIWFLHWLVLF